jgi:PBP1b-binding outer membrane lipoprotein LpoB
MKKIIVLLIFLAIVFSGCSKVKTQVTDSQKQPLQPNQVIDNYFRYYNEKNREGVLSTQTEVNKAPNIVFGFENLKYIKLISMSEDTNTKQKEAYMKYGRGSINGVKEENVIIYKVKYDVKYKKNGIGPQDSGIYIKWFTVIRKDNNSPWLIDDIGEG